MRKDDILKICNAVEALTIIYEPLYYEDYDYLLDKYFHTAYSHLRERDLDEILYSLVELKIIYHNKDDSYSVTQIHNMKVFEKEAELRFGDLLSIPFKEFSSGNEIMKYRRLCDAKNVKGMNKLQTFFDSLVFHDGVDVEKEKFKFFAIPQLIADLDKYIPELSKKCEPFDHEELIKLFEEAIGFLPRGFLRGYSFIEFNEMIRNEIENATYITEDPPQNKKNMNYSYVECLSLLAELEKTELYKLVDSDRVIELFINDKEVFVQILGYYGKDKAIIIYKDIEEMHYSLSLMKSDIEEIPDITYRLSQIECIYNPDGFVNEEMAEIMENKNYPPFPALVKLGYCRRQRLVNVKEANLVGAVLNDLLSMMKMVDKETISSHLGEKETAIDNEVNQVYVYEDKVLFGEYEDDEIGEVYDKTKVAKIDQKLINKIKKCNKKHDVLVGIYISPLDAAEYPWFYIIMDVNEGKIAAMEAIESKNNKDIANIILKELIKNDINPTSVAFNNELTYDLLCEYLLCFENIYIDDNNRMNGMYTEFMYRKFDDKSDNKNKKYN